MTDEVKESLDAELTALLNRHSAENDSDTPDFLLAEYLMNCLAAFNRAVGAREGWYGRAKPQEAQ